MRSAAFCHVACLGSTVIPLGVNRSIECFLAAWTAPSGTIARRGLIVWAADVPIRTLYTCFAVDALRGHWLVCSPQRPGTRTGQAVTDKHANRGLPPTPPTACYTQR